jgi:DNA-directed RNA polymerase specialized sigma24 family protein
MVSRYYCFSSDDFEDLEQELILTVLDNLNKYDPQKSSMETFVSVIINNKASDLIQYKKLRYNSELLESQRADNFESLIDNSIESIDTNHFSIEVINNRDAIDKLETNLSIAKIHEILPKDLSDLL